MKNAIVNYCITTCRESKNEACLFSEYRPLHTMNDMQLSDLCAEINRIQCERANAVLKSPGLNPDDISANGDNNAAG